MSDLPPAEAEARARKLAARLGCMAAIGFGTPIAMLLLIANALIPCSHGGDCKPLRGALLGGLGLVLAVVAGVALWRRMAVALPARARELAEKDGKTE